MAEGVIVSTICDPQSTIPSLRSPVYDLLSFFWVWTPLTWLALISGGLVLGLGRAVGVPGPPRMAVIWVGLGLASAHWAQYWPSEAVEPLPTCGMLAPYLLGFEAFVVLRSVLVLPWWIMQWLGRPGSPVPLGAPAQLWQHALVLIAPAAAAALVPILRVQGWGTPGANLVVALATCLLSLIWPGRGVWQARARTA